MMNKRPLLWSAATALAMVVTLIVVRHQCVLDSEDLAKAISKELPIGTPKAVVVNFIQKRHPMFCDDRGSQVGTRFSGLAGNLIYRKDIILIFEFDLDGRLKSYSKKEHLTFL
jgi:hypothetical protein